MQSIKPGSTGIQRKLSNANALCVGHLLDTRHARVLNPRPSVAFGVQKSRGEPLRDGSRNGRVLMVAPNVTLETIELTFSSRIEAVNEAAAAVSEFMNRLGIGEDVAFGVDMAVREAVTNAVIHGNKLNDAKTVEIKLRNTPGVFEISVHDQGSGFNPSEVPDPTKDENLLKTSGRGIFFMRNFMDEVQWSADPKGGTSVRMIKKL
jgi:serine/threonine-protein kinase RsbW